MFIIFNPVGLYRYEVALRKRQYMQFKTRVIFEGLQPNLKAWPRLCAGCVL